MEPESCHLLGMHLEVGRKINFAGAYDIIKTLFFNLIPILETPTGNYLQEGSEKGKGKELGNLFLQPL